MRRLISIAALSLVLAVPVWAQRGGHGGGGGHFGGGGARAGGFAGHVSGGHSFGGMHSAGMRSGPGFSRGFHSQNHGNWNGSWNWNHGAHSNHLHHHSHTFGIRNNCYGYACNNWGWGYAGWGWGWYDPWLWSSWDEQHRRFDEDYYRQYALADQWNERSLAEQQMRQREEVQGDQDAYAPRASSPHYAPDNSGHTPDPVPATVLVFRDRRQQEVQNYAIVGQILWAFTVGRTQKIPLAELDVAATEKANDDRGVTFRVPGANEGQ